MHFGCWGFQRHKRWARPLLLTYAGMWIAAVFEIHLVQFINTLSVGFVDLTF